jgi:hypothetical protein
VDGRISSTAKPNDIKNRSRDLPTCSIISQRTMISEAQDIEFKTHHSLATDNTKNGLSKENKESSLFSV